MLSPVGGGDAIKRRWARASEGERFGRGALGVVDKVARVPVPCLVVFELVAIYDLDGAIEPSNDVQVRVDRDDAVTLDDWGVQIFT